MLRLATWNIALALLVPASAWAEPPADVPVADEPSEVFEIQAPVEPEGGGEAVDESEGELDEAELDEAELDEAEYEDIEAPVEEPVEEAPSEPIRPPRVDGPYVGGLAFTGVSFAKVLDLDTPNPLIGGGAMLQAGDAVFPWMSIGIAVGGHAGVAGPQTLAAGALLVEFGFIPTQRYPLSIRAGFGFGGGRVIDSVEGVRPGFGGALFKGSLRYEFFPLAAKRRPDRGGGWAIGPELGWLGATPAGKGQPFVNTILLGLSTSIYFGS